MLGLPQGFVHCTCTKPQETPGAAPAMLKHHGVKPLQTTRMLFFPYNAAPLRGDDIGRAEAFGDTLQAIRCRLTTRLPVLTTIRSTFSGWCCPAAYF